MQNSDKTKDALDDVDMIGKNRDLQNVLYNGNVRRVRQLLDVVLKERRLSLHLKGSDV